MLVYRAFSPRDTRRIGEALGRLLGPGDVVCLEGQLGVGKTVFVQGMAAGMKVRGRVTSPTFTIVHEHSGKVPLYHIDAYRLEGADDAETAGIMDFLYGAGAVAVEWPGRIRCLLPEDRLDVEMRILGAGETDAGPGAGGAGAAGGRRKDAPVKPPNNALEDEETLVDASAATPEMAPESAREGVGEGVRDAEGGAGSGRSFCDHGGYGGGGAREIALFPRGERFRCMVEELKAIAGPWY